MSTTATMEVDSDWELVEENSVVNTDSWEDDLHNGFDDDADDDQIFEPSDFLAAGSPATHAFSSLVEDDGMNDIMVRDTSPLQPSWEFEKLSISSTVSSPQLQSPKRLAPILTPTVPKIPSLDATATVQIAVDPSAKPAFTDLGLADIFITRVPLHNLPQTQQEQSSDFGHLHPSLRILAKRSRALTDNARRIALQFWRRIMASLGHLTDHGWLLRAMSYWFLTAVACLDCIHGMTRPRARMQTINPSLYFSQRLLCAHTPLLPYA